MKRICLWVLAVFCLASCCDPEPSVKDKQALFIYFAGNNNLAYDGVEDLEDIKSFWLPSVREKDKAVLVFYHFSDSIPTLSRFYKDRSGMTVEQVIKKYPANTNSASVTTLETVLEDAEKAWSAEHRGIIFWSHGSGFLPEGYYAHPKDKAAYDGQFRSDFVDPYAWMVKAEDGSKSFAEDNDSEMDIMEMARILSSRKSEFILFDACLMGNVEVAYEFRDCCDYMLFSPTEILADGFPYEKMIQPIFSLKPKEAMLTIAKEYMAHYRALSGDYASATVTVVDMAGLEALAAACKPVFRNHQDEILTLDRERVQPYFRFEKHWFYDLDDFVQQVADDAEYRQVHSALDGAVIFKDATDCFLGLDMQHVSGLSVYIPRAEYTVLNNYYRKLAWNKATGLVP